jgi:hypothetical protein
MKVKLVQNQDYKVVRRHERGGANFHFEPVAGFRERRSIFPPAPMMSTKQNLRAFARRHGLVPKYFS